MSNPVAKKKDINILKKTFTLRNGMKMPGIGFGTNETWCIKTSMRDAVKNAIDVGYRLFDTGPTYGTERLVGEAIREKIASGQVKREDLFIVSKLWNTEHKFEKVVPACRRSLEELGLSYVDLYLINWPMDYKEETDGRKAFSPKDRIVGEVDYTETWRGMEECVRLGLTKSIGLSNFDVNQIFRVIDSGNIRPVVCQDECHLMLSQRRLQIFCRCYGIAVMGYAPLGNPAYLDSISYSRAQKVWQNPTVQLLSEKYKKTKPQVALRFLVDSDVVPIPKATSIEHIRDNIDLGDFKLTEEEMKSLHDFDCGYRIRTSYMYRLHPRYPFHGGYWS